MEFPPIYKYGRIPLPYHYPKPKDPPTPKKNTGIQISCICLSATTILLQIILTTICALQMKTYFNNTYISALLFSAIMGSIWSFGAPIIVIKMTVEKYNQYLEDKGLICGGCFAFVIWGAWTLSWLTTFHWQAVNFELFLGILMLESFVTLTGFLSVLLANWIYFRPGTQILCIPIIA